MDMAKVFSQQDVAAHSKPDDLFIVVDEDVYDMTKFQEEHPGGKKILQRVGGKDASKQFWKYHNESILKKYKKQLQVGSLNTKPKEEIKEPPAPPKKVEHKEAAQPGTAYSAPVPGPGAEAELEEHEAHEQLGDQIPYADPSWYQTVRCPLSGICVPSLTSDVVPHPLLQSNTRCPP